jgi:hypothetical protein
MGASSSPDAPQIDRDGQNIFSTVEDDFQVEDFNAEKSSEETLKTGEGQTDGGGEKEVPFHEHPRWKEVLKERDEARAKLQNVERDIEQIKSGRTAKEEPKLPFTDVTQLEEEKIIEWFNDNPKQFMANFYAQVRHELRQENAQEQGQRQFHEGVVKTVDGYRGQNPDFDEMWGKGEIQQFMRENPGHNAMSAHAALTAGKRTSDIEQRIKSEIDKAVKETTEKLTKQFQMKRHAQVLGSGPAASGGASQDKELQDTKTKGGLTNVLSGRLALMRRKAG